jgi:hypothetical protein
LKEKPEDFLFFCHPGPTPRSIGLLMDRFAIRQSGAIKLIEKGTPGRDEQKSSRSGQKKRKAILFLFFRKRIFLL